MTDRNTWPRDPASPAAGQQPSKEGVSLEDAMAKIAFLCAMHIERQPVLRQVGLFIEQQRDEIENLRRARDQWKDNYQTLLDAKVPAQTAAHVLTRTFWSPCRKYILTVTVGDEISAFDDNGKSWEPTSNA